MPCLLLVTSGLQDEHRQVVKTACGVEMIWSENFFTDGQPPPPVRRFRSSPSPFTRSVIARLAEAVRCVEVVWPTGLLPAVECLQDRRSACS